MGVESARSACDAEGRLDGGYADHLADAVAKSRCSACGARTAADYRIIYKGSSVFAMQGARSGSDQERG